MTRLPTLALSTRWPELVAAVSIGTARRPWTPLSDSRTFEHQDSGAEVNEAPVTSEQRCLSDLALAQAGRTAGSQRESVTHEVTTSPPDQLVEPPPAAAQLLELVLFRNPAGEMLDEYLLEQWCEQAYRSGYRIPHRLLPRVMATGPSVRKAHTALRPVLDARGRWLAETVGVDILTGWVESTELFDAETWDEMPLGERVEGLSAFRERDPAAARELLLSRWSSEPARNRAELVKALHHGLSMDDEPFLEDALDDRSELVRVQVVRLLLRLPQSRRAQRMAARLTPMVSTRRTFMRSLKVFVDDPEEPDAATVRDGSSYAKSKSESNTSFWITNIVSGAPLTFWDQFGSPEQILKGLEDSGSLRRAFVGAAVAQRNPSWAEALLKQEFNATDLSLLGILDASQRRSWTLTALSEQVGTANTLIWSIDGPWDREVSQAFLDMIKREEARYNHATIRDFAAKLHPDVAAQIPQQLPKGDGVYARELADYLANVATYHSITRSIQEAFR